MITKYLSIALCCLTFATLAHADVECSVGTASCNNGNVVCKTKAGAKGTASCSSGTLFCNNGNPGCKTDVLCSNGSASCNKNGKVVCKTSNGGTGSIPSCPSAGVLFCDNGNNPGCKASPTAVKFTALNCVDSNGNTVGRAYCPKGSNTPTCFQRSNAPNVTFQRLPFGAKQLKKAQLAGIGWEPADSTPDCANRANTAPVCNAKGFPLCKESEGDDAKQDCLETGATDYECPDL